MNPRQADIEARLGREGTVSVRALAQDHDVSEMTIRRDLARLERQGRLVRTHGGALLSRTGVVEFAFAQRARGRAAHKAAIAREAAKLVRPGMSVVLDTGTTTLEVARAIRGVPRLTVLTSSLAIASTLHACENIQLLLLGGQVRTTSPDLSGMLTLENLQRFQPDLALLGADALGPRGAHATDDGVAQVSQAMVAVAHQVALVADSGKFEQTALVRFAAWSEVDWLITDAGAPRRVRAWLAKHPCKVTYAPLPREARDR